MINFIKPFGSKCYWNTLDLYIKNLIKDQDEKDFQVSNEANGDCVNVHFFAEPGILKACKVWKGVSVFLPHGIADKNYRNKEKLKYFDYNIVSGPSWVKKYTLQGYDSNKIFVGGYPKMDHLFNKKQKKKNVLWIPTHNNMATSIWEPLSTFPDLLKYDVRKIEHFKSSLHPANKDNQNPTSDELLKARCCIVDTGSTLYESMALELPTIFPDWIIGDHTIWHLWGSFESQVFKEQIGYHPNSFDELVDLCNDDLEVDQKQETFIEGIFPKTLRGCSGEVIFEQLKKWGS